MIANDFASVADNGWSENATFGGAIPSVVDGMLAHLHNGGGATGVILCNPWGFDELCTRKFHRLIGDEMARNGISAIRFDYPGEGDSLPLAESAGIETWVAAALMAGQELRSRTGCNRVFYYGMGIGAAIAVKAGGHDPHLAGLILAGASLNGRRYLREAALREKVIEDGTDIEFGYPPGSTVLAAFVMEPELASDMRKLDVGFEDLPPDLPVLVLSRPEHLGDKQIVDQLRRKGAVVENLDFQNYGLMLDGVVTSPMPVDLIARIASWTARFQQTDSAAQTSTAETSSVTDLVGNGFRETAQWTDPGLFGVYCRPLDLPPKAVIIFLNMAYAPHIGWGGIWVDAARKLALDGIASFRVDLSNIGDSPAQADGPDQVVYSRRQLDDVKAVVNHIKKITDAPILLAGSCSGAHSALYAGAESEHVAGIVSINQLRLILDPGEDIEAALTAGARPLSDYKRRALSVQTYRRLFTGEVNMVQASRHIAGYGSARLARMLSPYLGRMTRLGRLRADLFELLGRLQKRQIPVVFVTCRTDGSLDQHALYFGKNLKGAAAFNNLRHIILENADHTLSPPSVRAEVIDILRKAAQDLSSGR